MRWLHSRIVSYASKFRWLAQVWTLNLGRVNSDVFFRWFVAAHFGGGSLPASPVVSLLTQGGGTGYGDSSLCSHSELTLLWKGTVVQELVLETSVVLSFHCCSYISLCSSPDSVRARQDCSSALSKRKHIADNTSEVREHSKLFWFIAIFVSPLSIYKYSKRNCITSLKMNVRKNSNMVSLKHEEYKQNKTLHTIVQRKQLLKLQW